MISEIAELSAGEAAHAIRNGELTSEAYATILLDRCDRATALNAFIALDRDAVLSQARAADVKRREGEPQGPLHGVPLAIKDNLDFVGLPTTGGAVALRHHRPDRNAAVLQKILNAGAIMLGKTNMHELAFGITTNNAGFGPARNPYDPRRIPGGSSGGTGVAVAARLAPAGIGTDTGGSVRIPAGLCGIVGFRPTIGRWSQQGILPISHTRDTAGPMARSVTDCGLLDAVVTGSPAEMAPRALKGLRLGIPRKFFWDPIATEIQPALDAFLAKLHDTGIILVEVDLSEAERLNEVAGGPIARFEARTDIAAYLRDHRIELEFDELVSQVASPDVKRILESSRHITEAEYRDALSLYRPALQKLYADCFARHDIAALVFPTTPLPAPKIGEDVTTEMNGRQVPTFPTVARNSGPGSVAGIPGLSLPIGLTASGLPVGIEIDGPAGGDQALLAIGLGLEEEIDPLPPPG